MGWIKSAVRSIKRAVKKVYNKVVKPIVKAAVAIVTAPIEWIVDAVTPDMPDFNAGDTGAGDQKGTTVNRRGASNTIPVVYANDRAELVKLGGIESHISASGTDNKYLYVTYVLCHGMIRKLHMNRQEGDAAGGDTQWNINYYENNGAYSHDSTQSIVMSSKGNILWKAFFGSSNNTFVPSWHNDKNIYPGLNVVKVRLEYPADDDSKDSSYLRQKPTFYFKVAGISHKNHTAINAVTSNNDKTIVSHMYDYLTNTRYGASIDSADIDTASFTKVFNFFNSRDVYNRFYRLSEASTVVGNIKNLLWYSACALIYEDGKFVLRLDPNYVVNRLGLFGFVTDYSTELSNLDITTYTITEEDVIGGVMLSDMPVNEIPHQWAWSYIDTETQTSHYPSTASAGGWWSPVSNVIKTLNNTIYKIDSKPGADINNIRRINTNGPDPLIDFRYWEGRVNNSISITVAPKHANVRVFDIINITYPKANLSNNEYVVTKITRNVDMSVTLDCKQALYDANNAISLWPTKDFDMLLKEQGLSMRKIKLLRPVGYGLDNNTQIDEFVPNMVLPTIANLVVDGTAKNFRKDDAGNTTPWISITFDEVQEPNVNTYNIYLRPVNTNQWELVGTTTNNTLKITSPLLKQGLDYKVAVSAVSQYGTPGNRVEADLFVSFAEGFEAIRREFPVLDGDDADSPIGQVVDLTGSIDLPEDGGLKWCQLQSPPVAGTGCVLGTDADHDLHDAWENLTDVKWSDPHPLDTPAATNAEGYYYETDKSRAVKLSDNERFIWSGYADVKVDWHDNTDTSGPFACYSVGWKVYNSSDVLLFTQMPATYFPQNNAPGASAHVIGPIANAEYALPFFYIYGHNTDASHNVNITGYELKIHKAKQKIYRNVDTSTLSGSVGSRELLVESKWINPTITSWTKTHTFREVNNVLINSAQAETKNIVGRYVGNIYSGGKFYEKINPIDINTNASTDAIVDVSVIGIPNSLQTEDENGIHKYFKIAEDVE